MSLLRRGIFRPAASKALGFGGGGYGAFGKPQPYAARLQAFKNVPNAGRWDTQAAIESGFYASTWVYRCVMTKCEGAAEAPFGWQKRTDGGKWAFDWDHPVSEVLGWWNDDYGPRESIAAEIAHLSLGGNALTGMFWSRDRRRAPGERDPANLRELRPETPVGVEYVVDDIGSLTSYIARGVDGMPKVWESCDIAHARLVDPGNPYWGVGRLQALARAVDTDTRAHDLIRARLEYGGVPDGILVDSTIVNGDQRQNAQRQIDEDWKKVRGPYVTGGFTGGDHPDIDWIPLGLSQKDMESFEHLGFSRDEICVGFGFNPALWGQHATYNNGETAERQKWTGAIIPDLAILAEALNRRIVPRADRNKFRIYFDTSGIAALRGNLENQVKAVGEMVDAGIPVDTACEIADLNIEKLPDGLGKLSFMKNTRKLTANIANPPEPPAALGRALPGLPAEEPPIDPKLVNGSGGVAN